MANKKTQAAAKIAEYYKHWLSTHEQPIEVIVNECETIDNKVLIPVKLLNELLTDYQSSRAERHGK